jgi:hypothetical protein
MKYVIDTSVDIKTHVQEHESGKAVRLRNGYHQGVHELIARDIFPTEMCNVLMILERSGKIKPGEADLFFRQFLSEIPPLFAAIPLLPRALEIDRLAGDIFGNNSCTVATIRRNLTTAPLARQLTQTEFENRSRGRC